MATIRVDDIDMYYETAGDGPPVVFVHGWGLEHAFWDAQMRALSHSFRVFACDLRGHGQTGKGDLNRYTMQRFSDDLARLLDGLAVEGPVNLVGHSMGSAIATQFLVDHPDRVRSLACCGPFHKTPETLRAALFILRITSLDRAERIFAPRQFYEPSRADVERVLAWYERAGLPVLRASAKSLIGYRAPAGLSSAARPVLLAYGERDPNRKQGAALQRLIPGAAVIVVPKASHMLPMEQPEAFNRIVSEFLPREATLPRTV